MKDVTQSKYSILFHLQHSPGEPWPQNPSQHSLLSIDYHLAISEILSIDYHLAISEIKQICYF